MNLRVHFEQLYYILIISFIASFTVSAFLFHRCCGFFCFSPSLFYSIFSISFHLLFFPSSFATLNTKVNNKFTPQNRCYIFCVRCRFVCISILWIRYVHFMVLDSISHFLFLIHVHIHAGRHVIARVGTTPLSFKRMTCFYPLIEAIYWGKSTEWLVNGPECRERAEAR